MSCPDSAKWGPKKWRELEAWVESLPPGACRVDARRFVIAYHDLVNFKLKKELHDIQNFLDIADVFTEIARSVRYIPPRGYGEVKRCPGSR